MNDRARASASTAPLDDHVLPPVPLVDAVFHPVVGAAVVPVVAGLLEEAGAIVRIPLIEAIQSP